MQRARWAICDTESTVSSGVNASRIRTARVSTDSPDADLAISGKYQAGVNLVGEDFR
jgi:hypothetical protein